MKAGIIYADREIRAGNAAEPEIGPREVLVSPHFAGICGTDLHIYRGEFHNRVRYPAILGHEFGGVVEEVGREVRGIRTGDRVAVDPIVPCHSCPACLTGHSNACVTLRLLGVDLRGGFGQLVAVPSACVYPLPENVPMEHAPMVEMYGLGHHVLRRGEVQPGETVAILGAGRLGLSVLDVLCHSASPSTAIETDMNDFRLERARQLGAEHVLNVAREDPVERVMDMTGGVGVDCAIECVGHYHLFGTQEPPLGQAVRMIRNGGRIVTAGLGEQLSPVHFKTLVLKEGRIIASRVTLGEFSRAIRMLSKELLHPDLLITHRMPLGRIMSAFETVDREEPGTIKIVLDVRDAVSGG
ncbi:MAG: alcohol dehydrogenase catalytic domain-containing protein [Acidobacteria bacterium]|nr:alcohol dehydrogenase catalytic domain-containing protein [Acidobacteriota bacterium]